MKNNNNQNPSNNSLRNSLMSIVSPFKEGAKLFKNSVTDAIKTTGKKHITFCTNDSSKTEIISACRNYTFYPNSMKILDKKGFPIDGEFEIMTNANLPFFGFSNSSAMKKIEGKFINNNICEGTMKNWENNAFYKGTWTIGGRSAEFYTGYAEYKNDNKHGNVVEYQRRTFENGEIAKRTERRIFSDRVSSLEFNFGHGLLGFSLLGWRLEDTKNNIIFTGSVLPSPQEDKQENNYKSVADFKEKVFKKGNTVTAQYGDGSIFHGEVDKNGNPWKGKMLYKYGQKTFYENGQEHKDKSKEENNDNNKGQVVDINGPSYSFYGEPTPINVAKEVNGPTPNNINVAKEVSDGQGPAPVAFGHQRQHPIQNNENNDNDFFYFMKIMNKVKTRKATMSKHLTM